MTPACAGYPSYHPHESRTVRISPVPNLDRVRARIRVRVRVRATRTLLLSYAEPAARLETERELPLEGHP